MQYQAAWESVDQHRAPEWFHDAKFGLFIHYQPTRAPENRHPEPTNYSAEEWVGTALDAGVRYVVPVCKHGDGHLRWPSAYREFGFGASEFGGPQDVITPLVETARRAGLKIGLYYCWATRDHPYDDQRSFVLDTTFEEREEILAEHGLIDTPEYTEYARNQVKELEELYRPDILWFDGDGYITGGDGVERYRIPDLVAWYYNRAETEERDVCLNDRLGTRYVRTWNDPDSESYVETAHGDFWTPEHQIMDAVGDHKWEANHTLHDGWSWSGPDRTVRSAGNLIELLVDIVSKNGNLLLNVGPKPDGTIPDADRRVLSEIGDWLDVNGEAIYGTRPFESSVDRPRPVPEVDWNDYNATWERIVDIVSEEGPLRFTRRGQTAYAIHTGWPGDTLDVPGLTPRANATIELLGVDEPLDWTSHGDGLTIHTPTDRPCDHAFAFRIPLPYE